MSVGKLKYLAMMANKNKPISYELAWKFRATSLRRLSAVPQALVKAFIHAR